MDHHNAQVGWTEAQWNRVREEVLQAWQRVRVAGSFLPIYSRLPPSTQVVPSEVLKSDCSVDDEATASLLEIALPVRLSRQQVMEEDLSSALLQFRRRATQLGQLEDWYIFNGTYPSRDLTVAGRIEFEADKKDGLPDYRPALDHLNNSDSSQRAHISGTPKSIEGLSHDNHVKNMRLQNPGSLGLIEGSSVQQQQDAREAARALQAQDPDNNKLIQATIINGINSLENSGYVAPYVCAFGREPFQEAFTPVDNSTVLPRDRIEPLIGRELLHASGIDIPPYESGRYQNLNKEDWPKRGVLLSMADEPVDLALAAEATVEFRRMDLGGKYVFFVFERFALRIKDAQAIVPMVFDFRR